MEFSANKNPGLSSFPTSRPVVPATSAMPELRTAPVAAPTPVKPTTSSMPEFRTASAMPELRTAPVAPAKPVTPTVANMPMMSGASTRPTPAPVAPRAPEPITEAKPAPVMAPKPSPIQTPAPRPVQAVTQSTPKPAPQPAPIQSAPQPAPAPAKSANSDLPDYLLKFLSEPIDSLPGFSEPAKVKPAQAEPTPKPAPAPEPIESPQLQPRPESKPEPAQAPAPQPAPDFPDFSSSADLTVEQILNQAPEPIIPTGPNRPEEPVAATENPAEQSNISEPAAEAPTGFQTVLENTFADQSNQENQVNPAEQSDQINPADAENPVSPDANSEDNLAEKYPEDEPLLPEQKISKKALAIAAAIILTLGVGSVVAVKALVGPAPAPLEEGSLTADTVESVCAKYGGELTVIDPYQMGEKADVTFSPFICKFTKKDGEQDIVIGEADVTLADANFVDSISKLSPNQKVSSMEDAVKKYMPTLSKQETLVNESAYYKAKISNTTDTRYNNPTVYVIGYKNATAQIDLSSDLADSFIDDLGLGSGKV